MEKDGTNSLDSRDRVVNSRLSFIREISTGSGGRGSGTPSHVSSKVRLTSAFITGDHAASSEHHDLRTDEGRRLLVEDALSSSAAETFFAMVVLADVFFACADIDERAQQNPSPRYAEIGSRICLSVYSVELLVAIYAKRLRLLKSNVEILNLIVLVSGYSEVLFELAGFSVDEFTILKLLRIVRSFRLVRTIKKFPALKELRKLLNMIGSCLKTLVWSFLACFIAMSIWSMVAVEFVHPLILKMKNEQEDIFEQCSDCHRAFSSVMRANLTIFKTVIAGDSWGQVAMPLIEAYPATAIVFVGAELSLLYGLLQLVVAVVVDTAAEFRQRDIMSLATEMEADQKTDLGFLNKMFERIDQDGSGEVDLEELIRAAESLPEFQSRLRVMDIDKADLEQLFYMIDEDRGNTISPDEFKQALSRWLYDSKTAPRFAKYNTSIIIQEQRNLNSLVADISKRLDKMASGMRPRLPSKDKKHMLQMSSEAESCSDKDGPRHHADPVEDTRSAINNTKARREGEIELRNASTDLREVPSVHENSQIAFKKLRTDLAKVVRQEQVQMARRHAELCIGQSVEAALNALHEANLVAIEQAFRNLDSSTGSGVGSGSDSLSISEIGEALVVGRQGKTHLSCPPEPASVGEEIVVVV